MKTKHYWFVVLAFGLVFAAAGCSGKKEEAAAGSDSGERPFVIRVGADSAAFSYQFRVANKAGIFDKYNIKAAVSTFSYGIDTINAAILGETDSAEGYDFAVASRFSESNKLRILATIVVDAADGALLYTRNNDVQTPADLKGKRVGVQKATRNEYEWGRLFEQFGLKAADVKQVYLSSNAELLAAYQSNEIDALWVDPAFEAAAREVAGSRILGDHSTSGVFGRGYLLLDADVIAREPAGVERFLKALDEATTYIVERPNDAARIAYEELRIPIEGALKDIETRHYYLRLDQEDLDHITDVANWSIENGLIKNRYDIRDFVDPRPLRNALPERVTIK
jgi:NitT/TauT family transport system substrate-binding protein